MIETSLTAHLIAGLKRPITAGDRSRAALHVLDWLGCALIGVTTPVGGVMKKYADTQEKGPCTIIGYYSSKPETAAFINGAFGNVMEMDDIHRTSILHPGPIVIPVAFAAAQHAKVSPEVFLDAVIRAYEVMIRIGESVGLQHYKYFHNTATCGPFGAAVASGTIYNLTDEELIFALGNSGSLTGGLWQMRNENVMTKQLHNAHAARSGFVAALLAKNGMTGPKYILEGPLGFYAAICPDADPRYVVPLPNDTWKIFDTSFKPWAACRHAHPTIDASLRLRAEIGREKIENVTIKTYHDAVKFCDQVDPQTVIQAKFSLQHAFAVSFLDGPPSLRSFDPQNYQRRDVAALRKKVHVESSELYTSAYPCHYGAAVEARTVSGKKVIIEESDALGDPEKPIDDNRIINKAVELMATAGLAAFEVEKIIEKTLALSEGGALEDLAAALKS